MKRVFIDKDTCIESNEIIVDKMLPSEKYKFYLETETITDINYTFFDMHYELEVGIVLSGSIQRQYADMEMEIGPGQIWLSGFWEPHGIKINKVPTEIVMFSIKPEAITNLDLGSLLNFDWISPFFAKPKDRPQMKTKNSRRELLEVALRAKGVLNRDYKEQQIFERLIVLEILAFIQEDWDRTCVDTDSALSSYSKINPALNLVFHSRSLIPVEDAARSCGLNIKTFSRTFKRVMGTSFSKYALAYRIRCTADDLINTDTNIKDTVYKWGFTDESHFNKVFYRYFNCNPGRYRKLYNIK